MAKADVIGISNVPSGLMGESSKAQSTARQYDSCTSIIAMMGAAVMVIMAEATADVGTWTRDMR